jgi:hypothetical protein
LLMVVDDGDEWFRRRVRRWHRLKDA